ncbi:MAG: hypothetical protein AAGG75_05685 [Bacteroidota bacterium]
MYKLLILLLFVSFSTAAYSATPATTAPVTISMDLTDDPGDRMVSKLNAKITLTTSQEQEIKNIASDFNFDGLSGAPLKQKRKEFRKKVIDEVLTADQITSLKAQKGQ